MYVHTYADVYTCTMTNNLSSSMKITHLSLNRRVECINNAALNIICHPTILQLCFVCITLLKYIYNM